MFENYKNRSERKTASHFLSERIVNLEQHEDWLRHSFIMASRLRDAVTHPEAFTSEVRRTNIIADAVALYHRLEELKDFEFRVEWRVVEKVVTCQQSQDS